MENIFRWAAFDENREEKLKKVFNNIEDANQDKETREMLCDLIEQISVENVVAQESAQHAQAAAASESMAKEDRKNNGEIEMLEYIELYREAFNKKSKTIILRDTLAQIRQFMNNVFKSRNFQPKLQNYILGNSYFLIDENKTLVISNEDGNEIDLPLNTEKDIQISPIQADMVADFLQDLVDFGNHDLDVEDNVMDYEDEVGGEEVVFDAAAASLPNLGLKSLFPDSGDSFHTKRHKIKGKEEPKTQRTLQAKAITHEGLKKILDGKESLDIGNGIVITLNDLGGEMKAWSITQNNVGVFEDMYDSKTEFPHEISAAINIYLSIKEQVGTRPQGGTGEPLRGGKKREHE